MKIKTFDCPLPELEETNESLGKSTNKKMSLMNLQSSNDKSEKIFSKGCPRPVSTSTRHDFPIHSKKYILKPGNISSNDGGRLALIKPVNAPQSIAK